ncbi:MAG: transcriptional regulator of arginine metabolism [Clostridiales bacterium]|jgi:transcriptional regulator of arginine metabolism|nr:transcriptional regulator of arginine metabolism [Clostridiales bacterium]
MKNQRHQKILELITTYPIERQEDLLIRLKDAGFEVTQATVSRDIRQLRLVKAATGDGHYRYTTPAGDSPRGDRPSRFENIFGESVVSIDTAGHIVMVKCHSGMASAACEVFDLVKWDGVIGSLAGENTFIILMRDEDAAGHLVEDLSKYMK